MNRHLKMIAGATLLALSTFAHAVPTLFFDGGAVFTPGPVGEPEKGTLSFALGITGSDDLGVPIVTSASAFTLDVRYLSDGLNGLDVTGNFGTSGGAPDFVITDGNANELLSGDVLGLSIAGFGGIPMMIPGFDFGPLTATLAPTGGSLLGLFANPTPLTGTLTLDNTSFGPTLFSAPFTGTVTSGQIVGVTPIPESPTQALVLVGLLALWTHRKKRSI
jgi:hypothetical protein